MKTLSRSSTSTPHPFALATHHAQQVLQRMQVDSYELYFEKKRTLRIEVKDQNVESTTQADDLGLSIRILKDQRLGTSYTTSLRPEAIEKALHQAAQISEVMPIDPHTHFLQLGRTVYPEMDQWDEAGLKVPLSEKIKKTLELESQVLSVDPRIQGTRATVFSESEWEIGLVDTEGEILQHRASHFVLSVSAKAVQGQESQMGSDFQFSFVYDELDPKKVAAQAARRALELLGGTCPVSQKTPVLLRNDVVAQLIELMAGGLSIEQVDKGRSLFLGGLNQKIFSNSVTWIDDALVSGEFAQKTGGGMQSFPFDGEGVPASKKTIIENGTLLLYLNDLYHSKKHQLPPTGNAHRSIKSPPSIGPNHLYMKPGKKSLDAFVREIKNGIMITQLMGLHTANPITGDFSLGASGLQIRDGKITGPLRGFAIAGNIRDVFNRVVEVGNDLRFFGAVGAPSLWISELAISGKETPSS